MHWLRRLLPNPDDKPNVIHKDHNKLNNHVENLEWGTVKEQCGHKKKHELEQLQMADSRVVYEIDTRTAIKEELQKGTINLITIDGLISIQNNTRFIY